MATNYGSKNLTLPMWKKSFKNCDFYLLTVNMNIFFSFDITGTSFFLPNFELNDFDEFKEPSFELSKNRI
jgi:hypothetical protein